MDRGRGVRRQGAGMAAALLLAACGDGGSGPAEGWLTVWGPSTKVSTEASITLAGTSYLPRGAGCTYYSGPWAPPGCLCELGEDARLAWTNLTNGAHGGYGPAYTDGSWLQVSGAAPSCVPTVWWRVADIALAPGSNLIEVTVSDGQTSGTLRIDVTRE